MPIRLNLLAEAQAAEEMRRKDPVKRALWASALLIAAMLAWSSSLQLKSILRGSELAGVEAQASAHAKEFQLVVENQRKTAEIEGKLRALRQLTTNRFLNGTFLDALQRTTVEDVQLLRLRVEQGYTLTEGSKPHTNDDRVVPGTPASAAEKIVVALESLDSSPNPGDQVNKFRDAVTGNAYFRSVLAKTNAVRLKNLSAPQLAPASGKACVQFTLEFYYGEKVR